MFRLLSPICKVKSPWLITPMPPTQLRHARDDQLTHTTTGLFLHGEAELFAGTGLEPVRRLDVQYGTDCDRQHDGHDRCHENSGPDGSGGEADAVPGAAELAAAVHRRLDLR